MRIRIKKRHLKKEKIFAEIVKVEPNIIKEIKDVLDQKGVVIADKKLFGIIKWVSLFEYDETQKLLKLKKTIFTEGIDAKKREKHDKKMVDYMQTFIALEDEYDKVEANGEIAEKKKTKIGKTEVSISAFAFFAGMFIWIATDEFMYFSLGLVISVGALAFTRIKK